ncbi:MAG: hypothetical protein K5839_02340 [Treponemataceae bacterium]|nr:hypothetical protein [Treponemataceae bacterium]
MSICPSKDIHSVYIDGELPEEFKSEYLAHVEVCSKCKEELNRLKALRQAFAQDRENIKLTQEQLDRGYEKLEDMLNFKKVTTHLDFSKFYPLINRLVPAMAAAILIVCFLPMGMNRLKRQSQELDYVSKNSKIEARFEKAFDNAIEAAFDYKNSGSLIKSTEYLATVDLEKILQERLQNPSNIYSNLHTSIQTGIQAHNAAFINVYNTQENLYNEEYSPFVGF